MQGIILDAAAFFVCFLAGRWSLAAGVGIMMAVGYSYGIARANLPLPAMHFLFDAALGGVYLSLLTRQLTRGQRLRVRILQPWMALLIGWPLLLFLFPVQDTLIQVVGLRAHIYFLPCVMIGAILEHNDYRQIARWIALLNLIAFGFALAEWFMGVPTFYPRNVVTEIIYHSHDLMGWKHFRIPATFVQAAGYGAMMTASVPLLLGEWTRRKGKWTEFYLISAALPVAAIGVFMSASRTTAITLGLLLVSAIFMGSLSAKLIVRSVLVALIVGFIVASNPRMQRFTTLSDTEMVQGRLGNSVNAGVLDTMFKYPMGNGLGGGGTSVPYFLRDRVQDPVLIENEYARIELELGFPGLLIWIAFIGWTLTKRLPGGKEPWPLSLRLERLFILVTFLTTVIGNGTLTAVPSTAILMIYMGCIATAYARRAEQEVRRPVFVLHRNFAID
jgi:hypothetical protein